MTPVMIAAKMGNAQGVRDFAAVGADLRAQSNEGFTALHWAALGERSSQDVIRALIEGGAPVDALSKEGSTPLMIAGLRGDPLRVKTLLKAGADAKAVTARGDTAAMAAANAGDSSSLALLLDAGADANAKNADGVGPIHLAVIKGDPACVRLLISRRANVNEKTSKGWSPALLAKNICVLEPLLEAGANPNDKASEPPSAGWTPLMFAAQEGDLFSVRRLLRAGADPKTTDLLGTTALDLAAGRGDEAGLNGARILAKAMGITLPGEEEGALIAPAPQ
jgi:ankyrin repeat protein